MVSLINFKTFDEDLSESQIVSDQCAGGGSAPPVDRRLYSSSPAGANQASQNDPSATQRQRPETAMSYAQDEDFGSNTSGKFQADARRQEHYSYAGKPKESGAAGKQQVAVAGAGCSASSFTVTWRKLKFCIEPKWHEKIANGPAALMALASRVSASSTSSKGASPAAASSSLAMATTPLPPPASAKTATTAPEESARSSAQAAPIATTTTTTTTTTTSDRVVLDQLDGSFKSGELTAILGPSGAGKTTLLDCLTGHRKSGLSGSIRFSLTSSSQASGALAPGGHPNRESDCQLASFIHRDQAAAEAHATHKQKNLILAQSGFARQPFAGRLDRKPPAAAPLAAFSETMNGDNLKVSIIPQNDHLIGHLTVYETLNYASKMKNCFEGQFDHKLNIGRVAQQLGLMSCLGTRINKLSGGQYKRVSIAQELLSSPDVLILDEPTSGLDAMTCYQTVQVLKKLTDDCRASGQKSIAVILTIHQPNSDVFQQFNHVYVVAQGGKCIYEGPPGSIESVINRVGICLPNSYYNPATMIVEIAAGKFGQEAICKLNAIQRKQYGEGALIVDEQNSTGDSAVDCPSSNYEDDEDEPDLPDRREPATERGKINVGFSMEGEPDVRDSNNNNNNGEDEPKCTLDRLAADEMVACPCESTGRRPSDIKLPTGSDHLEVVAASFSEKQQDRRKKRRRTRRRASEMAATNDADGVRARSILKTPVSAVRILMGAGGNGGGGGGDGDSGDGTGSDAGFGGRSEKRLKLNSLKADQKFPFWRHTYLHFHRSWLSIVRDPMLCSMQLALHIIVPVMVSLVYGTYVGKPNACPRAGPIDIMAYALEPTDTALQLQEDLRTTLENIGYIFFKLYGIIFAAMTVTVLTFPLDMHVLVKEFRNGWYGLASYFLGRTLADIPFQLTLPLLAMALSYYATGQPYSYLQWRFFSITAILILSSLIAQSQGLLFGAILMDKMKAAVFVAPAATTPIILFAGFLVRIQSIPSYLRPLSNLSYLRYAIEACLISRYGFNQCECDPAIFNQTVRELPPIARSMLDYWLSSYTTTPEPTSLAGNGTELERLLPEAAGNDTAASKPDLFTKLIDSLARANSFGRNITSCEQVVPYPMIDYDLKDEQLFSCFAILLAMLVFTRLLTFFIVCYKVKRKV